MLSQAPDLGAQVAGRDPLGQRPTTFTPTSGTWETFINLWQ